MSDNETLVLSSETSRPPVWVRLVLPAVILAAGVMIAIWMIRTREKPKRRPRGERAAVVEILPLKRSAEHVVVRTAGTVVPGKAVTLQPRVGGEVVRMAPEFVPGGRIKAGALILEIDPVDYALAMTNSRAALVRAEYDLKTEMGLQELARHEWKAAQEMSKGDSFTELDRELALRKPHLRRARSNLAAARAQLALAELNLLRTRVTAPFNCVVRSRRVNVGSQVTPQTGLAELVGTDAYWVRATLPADRLRWIRAADEESEGRGSPVTLRGVAGGVANVSWKGHVLRKLVDLEAAGRQAQILVELRLDDQSETARASLLLGSYVQLAVRGSEVPEVFALPRRTLREGKAVWVMNGEKRLDVREVEVVWRDHDRALIRGDLAEGEHLVVSDLATPVKGMLLQTLDDPGRSPVRKTEPGGRTRKGRRGPD